MNQERLIAMQGRFDQLTQRHPGEPGLELWFVRDLREPLGYARWENFLTLIHRAIESCKTTGCEPEHHFCGVTKMVTHGKAAQAFLPTKDLDSTDRNVYATFCPGLSNNISALRPNLQDRPSQRPSQIAAGPRGKRSLDSGSRDSGGEKPP